MTNDIEEIRERWASQDANSTYQQNLYCRVDVACLLRDAAAWQETARLATERAESLQVSNDILRAEILSLVAKGGDDEEKPTTAWERRERTGCGCPNRGSALCALYPDCMCGRVDRAIELSIRLAAGKDNDDE